jgi:O-antigen/teichoic acid export membrane protein
VLKKLRLDPSEIFINVSQGQEFKDNVVTGSIALVISQGSTVALSLISAVVLARLLTPYDFGIVGMVMVFINFLYLFKDIGLSHATIQKDEISSPQVSTLFWINGLISLLLGLILVASAPLVARFYETPELTAVMIMLALIFVLEGFTIQHHALLRRHLKFTPLSIVEVSGRVGHLIVAIIMALMGFRYWSLVGGLLARVLILLLLTYIICPWIPGRMQKGTGVRSMLKFGAHLTTGHILSYLARNLDRVLIGKMIGAVPLGLYTKAYSLLMQPLNQIRYPLASMALPVLSSLKNDPPRYSNYFNKLLDISISVALPISVYGFLESEFLIRLILGPQWMGAVDVFRILAIGGVFVSASFLPGLAMLSHGHSKRYMQLSIATSVITSVAFVAGISYGINGMAAAYTIASFLVLIPMYIISFRGVPIKRRFIYATILWPMISAAAAGFLAYFIIRTISLEGAVRHLIVALTFFAVYTALTLLRAETRSTLRSIWQSILARQKPKLSE